MPPCKVPPYKMPTYMNAIPFEVKVGTSPLKQGCCHLPPSLLLLLPDPGRPITAGQCQHGASALGRALQCTPLSACVPVHGLKLRQAAELHQVQRLLALKLCGNTGRCVLAAANTVT
jgi:hypothetical protein